MHEITADFAEARLHAIAGPPRSGKTLLLHLLGLLDEPDFGRIELFGETVSPAPDEIRREIRNASFGFVFANPCLLPAFSVAENVAMPLFRISSADELIAHRRVCELLDLLDLGAHANAPATSLDLDGQFLVALARALVHRPRVLFLVEPARPAPLLAPVRRLVDDSGITVLWGGVPGAWCDQADTLTRLDTGGVLTAAAT